MAGPHHRPARRVSGNTRRPERRLRVAFAAGLLLVTVVAYAAALGGAFIWDDDAHVTAADLRSLSGLGRIWTDPRVTQQYYPLTHSAFWLQYRLWGVDPVGYHVVNVVLHVAGALLLWLILERLAVPGAGLAAAIWALHPVNVESVAWITELKNTLSGVFYLAALLAYLRFDPPGAPAPAPGRTGQGTSSASRDTRDWRLYGVALALFACGLLSKTVTASLPAAMLVVVWWKEGRLLWLRHVLPLVPFFAIGVPLALTTAWLERNVVGAQGEDFAFTWVDRGLIAGRALWFYASKLAWPADLIFIYPRWTIDRSAWWQYLYPAGGAAVVGLLWALRSRWGRGPLAAVLLFAGTLVPALGFFNVYPFTFSFVADHFQYLASIGLLSLAAALIATGLERLSVWRGPVGSAVCGVLLLILAGLSWRQAHIYKDPETLYRDTIARNPTAEMAYVNLGELYWQRGRHSDAIEMYRAAVGLAPRHVHAYNNLGAAYETQGRYAEAAAVYRSAIAVKPDFADGHYRLGLALTAQGQQAEAVAHFKQALAITRNLAPAHHALGAAYAAQGQSADAIAAYKAAIASKPNYPEAYNDLGLQYRKHGQLAEAIDAYRAAIARKPDFASAHNNLGAAYGAQGNFAEALAAWQRAALLEPDGEAGRAAMTNIQILRSRLGR